MGSEALKMTTSRTVATTLRKPSTRPDVNASAEAVRSLLRWVFSGISAGSVANLGWPLRSGSQKHCGGREALLLEALEVREDRQLVARMLEVRRRRSAAAGGGSAAAGGSSRSCSA